MAPKVDAEASAEKTGILWLAPISSSGRVTGCVRPKWFSLHITQESWPWVDEKQDKQRSPSLRSKHSRQNGSALDKLMTTRFPSSAVVLEVAAFLEKRSINASVPWTPRTTGQRRHEDVRSSGTLVLAVFPVANSWKYWIWYDKQRTTSTSSSEPNRIVLRGVRQRKRRPKDRLRAADPR